MNIKAQYTTNLLFRKIRNSSNQTIWSIHVIYKYDPFYIDLGYSWLSFW